MNTALKRTLMFLIVLIISTQLTLAAEISIEKTKKVSKIKEIPPKITDEVLNQTNGIEELIEPLNETVNLTNQTNEIPLINETNTTNISSDISLVNETTQTTEPSLNQTNETAELNVTGEETDGSEEVFEQEEIEVLFDEVLNQTNETEDVDSEVQDPKVSLLKLEMQDFDYFQDAKSSATVKPEAFYVRANNELFAKLSDSSISYYHTDYLGNPILMTENDPENIFEQIFDFFGNLFGLLPKDSIGFTGKVAADNGYVDFGARVYDSEDSLRWNSPDPVLHSSESPYSYVANNPLKYIDPNGEERIWTEDPFGQHEKVMAPYQGRGSKMQVTTKSPYGSPFNLQSWWNGVMAPIREAQDIPKFMTGAMNYQRRMDFFNELDVNMDVRIFETPRRRGFWEGSETMQAKFVRLGDFEFTGGEMNRLLTHIDDHEDAKTFYSIFYNVMDGPIEGGILHEGNHWYSDGTFLSAAAEKQLKIIIYNHRVGYTDESLPYQPTYGALPVGEISLTKSPAEMELNP